MKFDPDSIHYGYYDPSSPAIFEELRGIIQQAIPEASVEHIGSSSVAGTSGRNVIDIAISVNEEYKQGVISRLIGLGFQQSGLKGVHAPMLRASTLFMGKTYGIQIFVHETDSKSYMAAIFFRDYMKEHPEAVKEYDEIKKRAAERAKKYDLSKLRFIRTVVKKRETEVREAEEAQRELV